MNSKNIKISYAAILIFVIALFVGILYKPLVSTFYEQDMWWYVSSISHDTKGLGLGALFSYIIKPLHFLYPFPYFKLVPVINLVFFGPQLKYFINIGLFFLIATAVALFYLSKKLGFDRRVGIISAVIFSSIFIHFHAYSWPVALQHLLATFFISYVLIFYLITDSCAERNQKFYFYYSATIIFAFLSSFARITVLIAPIMVLLHIVFCSQNGRERLRKYNTWLPFFAIYAGYPVIFLKYMGDDALMFLFSRYKLAFNLPVLFLTAAALLAGVELFLVLSRNRKVLLNKWQATLLMVLVFLSLIFLNIRNLLLPYNILRPYMCFLQAVFTPIETALQVNSTQPYYYIPLWHSVPYFFLALSSCIVFFKQFAQKKKVILLLVIWYIFGFMRLNLENAMPSRYFIYVTPVLSLIFASTIIYIYDFLSGKLSFKPGIKKLIFSLVFACFFIQGLIAIRLLLWRGKFTNTFMLYDYIRIADTLKQSLPKAVNPANIYVNDILPMAELADKQAGDCKDYYNFRFVLAQAFDDRRMLDVRVNQAGMKEQGIYAYMVKNGHIYDYKGNDLDKYASLMTKTREYLRKKDYPQASVLLQAALQERPFLLNYILSGKYDLINIKYLCGNVSLYEWLRLIKLYYMGTSDASSYEKLAYISDIIDKEIGDYLMAIFYKSYLEYLSGNKTQSVFWLNKIVYFDDDRDRVMAKLRRDIWVEDGKNKDEFFAFMDTKLWYWYRDTNYVKNYRFRFQMFLFELMLNRPLFEKKTLVQD